MSILNGKLDTVLDALVTWERAQHYLKVYEDAKKDVSGNAECRRIARMRIVLDMFLDELREEVEGAERESV